MLPPCPVTVNVGLNPMAVFVKLLVAAWALLWIACQVLGLIERCGGTIGKSAGDTLARLRRTGKIAGRILFFALVTAAAYMVITRFVIGQAN